MSYPPLSMQPSEIKELGFSRLSMQPSVQRLKRWDSPLSMQPLDIKEVGFPIFYATIGD
jgi:hypothetical protein